MRILLAILLITFFLPACNQHSGSVKSGIGPDKKIIKEAVAIAENYATQQITDAKRFPANDGSIVIGNDQWKFVIHTSGVHAGLINDDNEKDAIVSLDSYQGQFQVPSWQLILLKSRGRLKLEAAIEYDMTIRQIEDRLITAEVPTHTRNSPLFNCSECIEIMRFRFENGELVRAK
ncbi:MAG: hypothetical protein WAL29_14740 [Bacteroidales bacterium]